MFTYKCEFLNWVKNLASIGYSGGGDFFFNHPLSRRSNVNDIACLNQPITPWSNVVFNSENGLYIMLMRLQKQKIYFIVSCTPSVNQLINDIR